MSTAPTSTAPTSSVAGDPRGGSIPDALAAIDIGTNSVHMLIARVAANGRFEVLTRQKEMVRLGSGQGEMKLLEPDAIDRGVEALARCRSLADSFEAPVYAVATSAVREATNAEEFLRRARDEAGIDVEVISGYEEARLIQLGVLQALPVFEQRLVLVDVGGGSTEVLVGQHGDVEYARSVKLGSLRMTRRFFPDGVVEGDAVTRCRAYVRNRLAPMVRDAEHLVHDIAVASSGTAEALASMALQRRDEPLPQSLNAASISREELTAVIDELAAAPTVEERRKLPGVDPSRADILIGGGIVLEQVCEAVGIIELTISEYALREGVLLDALHRWNGGTLHHLSDLRRSSVFHLMELCDDDPDHSLQVARLALQLHDALGARLGLGDADRELLEAAALLSNVGLFVSHSGHHKHSYYVIRNSEHLMGFTDREIELIAQVARYHRKSQPAEDKHPEFAALSEEDRARVRSMAGMLRVAIGLDRNHDGAVGLLKVTAGAATVSLQPVPAHAGTDLTLERYSGDHRSSLLSQQLGCEVVVVAD
jgi:exopolyphosphatase/guanosine-5'-triphosphate,3'-diphosphate pyrophosphatase